MGCFSPVTSSVQPNHRPVSYYALLKGWLPPSPPSGCHQPATSFPTKQPLWDLNVRSGLFPSRLWTLAPKVCLLALFFISFGVAVFRVSVFRVFSISFFFRKKTKNTKNTNTNTKKAKKRPLSILEGKGAFGVSLELVRLWAPLSQRVLYLPLFLSALPK